MRITLNDLELSTTLCALTHDLQRAYESNDMEKAKDILDLKKKIRNAYTNQAGG